VYVDERAHGLRVGDAAPAFGEIPGGDLGVDAFDGKPDCTRAEIGGIGITQFPLKEFGQVSGHSGGVSERFGAPLAVADLRGTCGGPFMYLAGQCR
jgi:hypothetical protein